MNVVETVAKRMKGGLGLHSDSRLVQSIRPAYGALLQTLYSRKGITREIHGEKAIRLRPEFRACSELDEPAVFATLKACVKTGDVVLDIGANIGVFSLVMASWVGASGRVFAFEPAPVALQALNYHVGLNHLRARVEIVEQAIGARSGQAMFYADGANGENSMNLDLVHKIGAVEAVAVSVTTVDEFCVSRKVTPNVIKIDIEGFEFHALRGARQTLEQHRPVLVVEFHPQLWKAVGTDAEDCVTLLRELRYRSIPIDEQTNPFAEFGHVLLEPVDR